LFDYVEETKMNVNVSIIDLQLEKIKEEIRQQAYDELGINNDDKLKSVSFVYHCVRTMLDLDGDAAFDCLTEGGGDFGVDALYRTGEEDGEFGVTLFQGKYKRNLKGDAHFEQMGIERLINAIRHIFDPSSDLGNINERLRAKVEEVRSLIRDGLIPRVRVLACNNGLKWNDDAQTSINRCDFDGRDSWEHVNHDVLIGIIQSTKPISETLYLTGKAIVEDFNFSRVCIGRIQVAKVADIMKRHGEKLLERNIRRYLGLHKNRVNEGIRATLTSQEDSSNFYFFNNGLTLVCDDFSYNAMQGGDYQVKVENLQIVNGGQTCMTIHKTSEELASNQQSLSLDATVMVRLYKLPKSDEESKSDEDIVSKITHATNSQNPVDLKDLRANDLKQKQLEQGMKDLGYTYRPKRTDFPLRATDITSGVAAEAVLAVWREEPNRAKFFTREHFGKLYNKIFSESLNPTQVIIAALLYRIAENHRRRPHEEDHGLVRYASCFIAMQMGRRLLNALDVSLDFDDAKRLIDNEGEEFFRKSCRDVEQALKSLYGNSDISMQQLSATFRRGDLIEKLEKFS